MKATTKKFVFRVNTVALSALSVACICPSLSFAADEQQTTGINAILPAMDEFIPMLVAFLVLLAVLARFGWPMFDEVLKKRETTIREALEKAESARIESERLLEQYQEKLIEARHEGQTIINEAKQTADKVRADITAKAQTESENMIAKAREAIESEKNAAILDLQASMADLTVAVTTRVIGEDFSDADHRRLIERSIEEVGALNG